MLKNQLATLVLEDSSQFKGHLVGSKTPVTGDVVVVTNMSGYCEILSNPSTAGQILLFTYPLIGNYGIPELKVMPTGISTYFDSNRIFAAGIIVADLEHNFSHWNGKTSLNDWLIDNNVPGIVGLDTRTLTKLIAKKGNIKGRICFENETDNFNYMSIQETPQQFVEQTSCTEVITYNEHKNKQVVLIDCGIKHSLLRSLLDRDFCIHRVPYNYDVTNIKYDGIIISNGPGDPNQYQSTINNVRKALPQKKPIYGFGLGHQILSLVSGGKVKRMELGHHNNSVPVRENKTNNCFISSQHHNFIVDNSELPDGWEESYFNLNDSTNEGLSHKTLPFFSTQFYPETDNTGHNFLIDRFEMLL